MDLTFGEQIKLILKRRGMTIKELAEKIERETGMKMSRQNLTQRLTRDNFQEQDMKMIVEVLECKLTLTVIDEKDTGYIKPAQDTVDIQAALNKEMTIGELADSAKPQEDLPEISAEEELLREEAAERDRARIREIAKKAVSGIRQTEGSFLTEDAPRPQFMNKEEPQGFSSRVQVRKRPDPKAQVLPEYEELPSEEVGPMELSDEELYKIINELENGVFSDGSEQSLVQAAKEESHAAAAMRNTAEMGVVPDSFRRVTRNSDLRPEPQINPRTGEEYESNVVRNHPKLKGYIQVYDRGEHKWIDMTEWAFLGFQERKKVMLGMDYKPPIYLD